MQDRSLPESQASRLRTNRQHPKCRSPNRRGRRSRDPKCPSRQRLRRRLRRRPCPTRKSRRRNRPARARPGRKSRRRDPRSRRFLPLSRHCASPDHRVSSPAHRRPGEARGTGSNPPSRRDLVSRRGHSALRPSSIWIGATCPARVATAAFASVTCVRPPTARSRQPYTRRIRRPRTRTAIWSRRRARLLHARPCGGRLRRG